MLWETRGQFVGENGEGSNEIYARDSDFEEPGSSPHDTSMAEPRIHGVDDHSRGSVFGGRKE